MQASFLSRGSRFPTFFCWFSSSSFSVLHLGLWFNNSLSFSLHLSWLLKLTISINSPHTSCPIYIVGSVLPTMNLCNAFNSSLLPLSGTTTTSDAPFLPAPYNSSIIDSLPHKTPIKFNSGLSYNLPAISIKHFRDSINNATPLLSYKNTTVNNDNTCAAFSFLGQDISLQIHQQQLDIDCLIAHHVNL